MSCPRLLIAIALLLTAPLLAAPRELSPTLGNLEGEWLFRTDVHDAGLTEGWSAREYADGDWRTLVVPGSWEAQGITDPRPGQEPKPTNGMPYTDYDGVAWYRLHFTAPAAWDGQDLELLLGSVDDQDMTHVNGALVGQVGDEVERSVLVWRRYTVPAGLLRPGEDNVLALRVVDGGGPGGIMGPSLSLLPEEVLSEMTRLPDSGRPLADRFSWPSGEARILKIIHSWPDDPGSQDAMIQGLLAQGFGGVVCNVSFDEYLQSPQHWRQFRRAVAEAKAAGMALWLYDERGYPSGTAGGLTMEGKLVPRWREEGGPPPPAEHPEWEARGLLIADAVTEGGEVTLDVPPGDVILAAAYPRQEGALSLEGAVDLSPCLLRARLTWDAPPGSWQVLAITESRLYEGTHAAVSLADKLPYINLLMPEPTARFLEVTHARYARHLGDDLGDSFVATFTDEPSLMGQFMRAMPYRVLPWAPNLPTEFAARRGRELAPLVPLIVADSGAEGQRARYEFWQTVGELVSDCFFGQIQQWCSRHNIPSGGHLLAEESILDHVSYYGDFFGCVRRLDAPSIDCLTSTPPTVPWTIARLVSSAGELEGKTITMCETSDFAQIYRPGGDDRPARSVTEAEIRGTCNRLMLGGINTITSYYSFRDLQARQLRRLNEWVGRCCTALAGGDQVADIAVLYPIESLWPRFTPSRRGPTDSPEAHDVQGAYRAAGDGLYAACRDFGYIDSRAVIQSRVDGGVLCYDKPRAAGSLAWRVLVLPGVDTLPLEAWERLGQFVRSGGAIVALGALPANSEDRFPDPRVEALAEELFGRPDGARVCANAAGGAAVFLPRGAEALLATVIDGLLGRDVTVPVGSPIRATHRRIEDAEVYFVINDSPEAWSGRLSVAAAGPGERWDPATGERRPLSGPEGISLELEPYGATLLRFAAAALPARFPAQSGGLPGLALRPLPEVIPTLGKGEFVQSSAVEDEELSTPKAPVWRMTGTLTKSDVDTFLFATFSYPEGLDLSDAHCLRVESWVPEGQQTPADLLVIVRDRDGGDYLASTNRRLGASGRSEVFLPLSRLAPAGWSRDPDGTLNTADIGSISVGWGGYFGREGERVQFSLSTPQAGVLRR